MQSSLTIKEQTPAVCNECQQEFILHRDHVKVESLTGGNERTYFTCPHCKKEYTAFYTNREIRNLRMDIKRKRAVIETFKAPLTSLQLKTVRKHCRQLDVLVRRNTEKMNRLKEQMENQSRDHT